MGDSRSWNPRSPMYPTIWPPTRKGTSALLDRCYGSLRHDCDELEQLIECGTFTEKELKRLDKAITAMKIGFKIMKKVRRSKSKTSDEQRALAVIDQPDTSASLH